MFSKIRTFLTDVRRELKTVNWPSRRDTLASTGVVLVVTFIVAFYLGIIDFLLSQMVQALIG